MIPLAAFEEIIDASGVAPRIEAMLPIGVRPRQLSVRTLLAGMCLTQADHRPAHLMGIWQVTALGDGAREPYGQIAGPCPARFTSLAIQVRNTSTKMDGIWLVRLVPGTRSAHQGMTPRVRSGSRQRPAVHVTRALETRRDEIRGGRCRCRYGWSWPEPPAGATPHQRREPPSPGQDRGLRAAGVTNG